MASFRPSEARERLGSIPPFTVALPGSGRQSTVARHTANIYAKIGVRGRTEAVAFAVRNGLMEL
jgi:hypothetical protein